MRHGDKINNLGRKTAHRKAMLSNMTCSLIQYKRIITTIAKAKALRVYAEPIITRCKEDTMHNRRIVFSHLQDKEAIKELFGVVSDKVADRPGGYTRIIKLPRRVGDGAEMAYIELVDFNETYNAGDKNAAKKTRRSRRSNVSVTDKPAEAKVTAEAPATAEAATEAPATAEPATEAPATETTEAPQEGNAAAEATA